jgi:hypothetical protein
MTLMVNRATISGCDLPSTPSGLDHHVAHDSLEHLGRDAHVALHEFAETRERRHDIRLPHALHLRPPAGSLKLLEPLPLGGELAAH